LIAILACNRILSKKSSFNQQRLTRSVCMRYMFDTLPTFFYYFVLKQIFIITSKEKRLKKWKSY
ncbi:MAG: hypothetical protein KAU60_05980, partial [Desulfobacterales bacterium]|nr:hypothetical protein [Desulfobacterales bacterium]